MVNPFLVMRSTVNVAFSVVYVYLMHDQGESFGVLNAVLLGVPNVVLYTGPVFIGFQKDWFLPEVPSDVRQDDYRSAVFSQPYGGQEKQPFAVTAQPSY